MAESQSIIGSELKVRDIEQLDLSLIVERLINCLERFRDESQWRNEQSGFGGTVGEQIQEANELLEKLKDLQNFF